MRSQTTILIAALFLWLAIAAQMDENQLTTPSPSLRTTLQRPPLAAIGRRRQRRPPMPPDAAAHLIARNVDDHQRGASLLKTKIVNDVLSAE